jgi:hypothetical protein
MKLGLFRGTLGQFSITLATLLFAAANASAGIPYTLSSTMTIPYPATATGSAVDLTVHYTNTSYTTGGKAITAVGSPFTESTTTSAPDSFSQVFDSPGGGVQIAPGESQTLSWSVLSVNSFLGGTYDETVDTGWNTEWVGSYDWGGIPGSFVPMSFATTSSGGTTQLQFVNQMPSTDITYSELSIFNNGGSLISGGSGSILGGTSTAILAPFPMGTDFALHVKDDYTGVRYDLTWSTPALGTPEPSGLFLVAPAAAMLWWRRRRKAV